MKQAQRRKYHYIYKTTRLDGSGRFYIGLHSTDDLDDGYLGSGSILSKSIKKYGREKHFKEILEFLPDRESLKFREKQIVCEELISNPLCMNLQIGGNGGPSDDFRLSPKYQDSQRRAGRNGGFANRSKWSDESIRRHSEKTSASMTRIIVTRHLLEPDAMKDILVSARQAAQSDEAKIKRKATFEKIGHQKGENNSQFGSCWVIKDSTPKKIKNHEIEDFLARGFVRGRI